MTYLHFGDVEPIQTVTDDAISRMSYHAIMEIDDDNHRRFSADRIEKGPPCRFHRKFGEDRFLRVTTCAKSRGDGAPETMRLSKQMLKRHLRPFSWCGRWWSYFTSKVRKQDRRYRKDPGAKREMQHIFFATRGWTPQEEKEETANESVHAFWNDRTTSMNLQEWSCADGIQNSHSGDRQKQLLPDLQAALPCGNQTEFGGTKRIFRRRAST